MKERAAAGSLGQGQREASTGGGSRLWRAEGRRDCEHASTGERLPPPEEFVIKPGFQLILCSNLNMHTYQTWMNGRIPVWSLQPVQVGRCPLPLQRFPRLITILLRSHREFTGGLARFSCSRSVLTIDCDLVRLRIVFSLLTSSRNPVATSQVCSSISQVAAVLRDPTGAVPTEDVDAALDKMDKLANML